MDVNEFCWALHYYRIVLSNNKCGNAALMKVIDKMCLKEL